MSTGDLGGTGLVDMVGGSVARAGRSGAVGVPLVAWAAAAVKLAAAAFPLLPIRARPGRRRRLLRVLASIEAEALAGYGGVLTAVGLLVRARIVHPSLGADQRALAWHAYLWDPWFLLWGLLLAAALLRMRHQPAADQAGSANPVPPRNSGTRRHAGARAKARTFCHGPPA